MSRSVNDVDANAETLIRPPATPDDDLQTRPTVATARGRFEGEKSSETSGRVAVDAGPWPVETTAFAERYEARSVLGEGGMGEVRLCRDRLVGRDIALKVLR